MLKAREAFFNQALAMSTAVGHHDIYCRRICENLPLPLIFFSLEVRSAFIYLNIRYEILN
jgi:hypothetical protein